MNSELWKSVQSLADAWRAEPAVQRVLSRMPSKHKPPQTGLAARIEMLQAGGLPCRPLMMADIYSLGTQLYENAPTPAGIDGWLTDAYAIERAYVSQLGWIRGQLPGYPMLRLPQLVAGSPLMSADVTRDLPWYRQHLAAGFQTMTHPPARLSESRQFRDATHSVLTELRQQVAWMRFAELQAAMDVADFEALREINTQLRQRVREEAVTAFEPNNLSRREEFRASQLRHAVDKLTGKALAYVTAFDALNELLTMALDYVLNYLVEFDRVDELAEIADIDIDGDEVAFSSGDVFVRTRSLVYLSDPAIDEGGVVTMTAFAMDNGEARFRNSVQLLPGLREGLNL